MIPATIPFLIFLGGIVTMFIGLVLMGAGIGQPRSWANKGPYERPELFIPGWILAVIGGIFSLVWLITWPIQALETLQQVQSLDAFYTVTISSYDYAVEQSQQIVIDPNRTRGGAITDLAYQQQGVAVADRIRELRDKVEWYNNSLYQLRARNRLPIIGVITQDVPERLAPISLQGR